MSNSDKTFIRVFRKDAEPTIEPVEVPPAQTVELHSTKEHKLAVVVDDEPETATDCQSDHAECVPRVICEVFDFGNTTGTNVITTGLFLDAVDQVARQQRAASRHEFAAFEVDRFALPRPCEVIEEYAADTLDDVADRMAKSLESGRNLVSVRSWARGAGRTTLSICMARRLAYHGKSVLLIDGDFDNPRLATQLGVKFETGWEATLGESVDAESCCVSSVRDGFSIMPLVDGEIDFVDIDVVEQTKKILAKVCDEFDVVMVDAGPGSQIWDHPSIAEQLGIVIVQDNRRPETEIDDLVNRMKRRGTPILGLIGNFSKAA